MILTAHQPAYLPYLGLFHKIAQADVFVSFDDVQYCPKDYQNRNKIWTSHGPQWLTVPVHHSRETKIYDVQINKALPWQRKHWKSIEQSYHKAEYWSVYNNALAILYAIEYDSLCALNADLLRTILGWLGIATEIRKASDYTFHGEKSARVLDMCQQLGADTYIFGALGRNYADVAAFELAEIKVIFQDYRHPVYSQFGGEFMSHLSILDLLFHHGPKAKQILIGERT